MISWAKLYTHSAQNAWLFSNRSAVPHLHGIGPSHIDTAIACRPACVQMEHCWTVLVVVEESLMFATKWDCTRCLFILQNSGMYWSDYITGELLHLAWQSGAETWALPGQTRAMLSGRRSTLHVLGRAWHCHWLFYILCAVACLIWCSFMAPINKSDTFSTIMGWML